MENKCKYLHKPKLCSTDGYNCPYTDLITKTDYILCQTFKNHEEEDLLNKQMLNSPSMMDIEIVIQALVLAGYRELGGSKVYRLLENDYHGIKVFYNNYKNPTHIVVKQSYPKKEEYEGQALTYKHMIHQINESTETSKIEKIAPSEPRKPMPV